MLDERFITNYHYNFTAIFKCVLGMCFAKPNTYLNMGKKLIPIPNTWVYVCVQFYGTFYRLCFSFDGS